MPPPVQARRQPRDRAGQHAGARATEPVGDRGVHGRRSGRGPSPGRPPGCLGRCPRRPASAKPAADARGRPTGRAAWSSRSPRARAARRSGGRRHPRASLRAGGAPPLPDGEPGVQLRLDQRNRGEERRERRLVDAGQACGLLPGRGGRSAHLHAPRAGGPIYTAGRAPRRRPSEGVRRTTRALPPRHSRPQARSGARPR